MMVYKKGSSVKPIKKPRARKEPSRTAHYTTAWRIGPSIRQCCLDNVAAQVAWWWEVGQRFDDVTQDGIEDDPILAHSIVENRRLIEDLLATVVPRPPLSLLRKYALERERQPRRTKLKVPKFAATLGIPWPCTVEELNTIWRRLALQHHPDRGGKQEDFVRVKLAYETAKRRIDGIIR